MLPSIEKIIHRTDTELFLRFVDGDIKVLNIKTFRNIPGWQLEIIKDRWKKAKVGDMGHLEFNAIVNIGADIIKSDSRDLQPKELFDIIENKRIAKKRIMQTLSSLL